MNDDNQPVTASPKAGPKLSLSVTYRTLCFVLLLVIAGMLAAWHPWSAAPSTNARTIKVTGEAKITATPDEFAFNPTYESKSTDKAAALKELSAKSDEITSALKKLGVPANKIKTSTSGYDYPVYYGSDGSTLTYSLYFTITVNNVKDAQKVQDYLITTAPTGGVSPNASFSTAKQKSLESQARDQATREARAKADQSAKNLGFKIGAVKTVEDGSFNGGYPVLYSGVNAASDTSVKSTGTSLQVQPGENDLTYSVTVVYYLR